MRYFDLAALIKGHSIKGGIACFMGASQAPSHLFFAAVREPLASTSREH